MNLLHKNDEINSKKHPDTDTEPLLSFFSLHSLLFFFAYRVKHIVKYTLQPSVQTNLHTGKKKGTFTLHSPRSDFMPTADLTLQHTQRRGDGIYSPADAGGNCVL